MLNEGAIFSGVGIGLGLVDGATFPVWEANEFAATSFIALGTFRSSCSGVVTLFSVALGGRLTLALTLTLTLPLPLTLTLTLTLPLPLTLTLTLAQVWSWKLRICRDENSKCSHRSNTHTTTAP
ncbi:MAG: hypothetical protein MK183_11405, partial [Verrucomicrobiales bacterium]|nr:hypothetical protein [Verrucomicrobiales bacterium]